MMASVMLAVEIVEPFWPWWKTALTVTGLCVMAGGFVWAERWLP